MSAIAFANIPRAKKSSKAKLLNKRHSTAFQSNKSSRSSFDAYSELNRTRASEPNIIATLRSRRSSDEFSGADSESYKEENRVSVIPEQEPTKAETSENETRSETTRDSESGSEEEQEIESGKTSKTDSVTGEMSTAENSIKGSLSSIRNTESDHQYEVASKRSLDLSDAEKSKRNLIPTTFQVVESGINESSSEKKIPTSGSGHTSPSNEDVDKQKSSNEWDTSRDKIADTEVLDPSEHALQLLTELYRDVEFSDMKLEVADNVYTAHKAVLVKGSVFFERMFKNNASLKASSSLTLRLEESRDEAKQFDNFLRYMYGHSVTVTTETALPLARLADKYGNELLRRKIVEYMIHHCQAPTCRNHTLAWYRFSRKIKCKRLQEACFNFLLCNFDLVMRSPGWEEIGKNTLKRFLCDNDLVVSNEYSIYLGLERWLQYSERRYQSSDDALDLLQFVRFPMIFPEQLQIIQDSELMKSVQGKYKHFLYEAFRFHATQEQFREKQSFIIPSSQFCLRNYKDKGYSVCQRISIRPQDFTSLLAKNEADPNVPATVSEFKVTESLSTADGRLGQAHNFSIFITGLYYHVGGSNVPCTFCRKLKYTGDQCPLQARVCTAFLQNAGDDEVVETVAIQDHNFTDKGRTSFMHYPPDDFQLQSYNDFLENRSSTIDMLVFVKPTYMSVG